MLPLLLAILRLHFIIIALNWGFCRNYHMFLSLRIVLCSFDFIYVLIRFSVPFSNDKKVLWMKWILHLVGLSIQLFKFSEVSMRLKWCSSQTYLTLPFKCSISYWLNSIIDIVLISSIKVRVFCNEKNRQETSWIHSIGQSGFKVTRM